MFKYFKLCSSSDRYFRTKKPVKVIDGLQTQSEIDALIEIERNPDKTFVVGPMLHDKCRLYGLRNTIVDSELL